MQLYRHKLQRRHRQKKVAFLTGCQEKELTEPAEYKKVLEDWMISGNSIKDMDYVAGFLHKVDYFNLNYS